MKIDVTVKLQNDPKKMSKSKEPLEPISTSLQDPFISEFLREMAEEFRDPIDKCDIIIKMSDC